MARCAPEATVIMTTPENAYELFDRAIVDRDVEAWATIATRYRPLLITWVKRCPSFDATDELCEDLVDEALSPAWVALTFSLFPTLATLMAYLRACAFSAVIDAVRGRRTYERVRGEMSNCVAVPMEQVVLERLGEDQLWKLVSSLIKTEAERLVLHERFVLDLPLRVIQARHPMLFPKVTAVYTTLHNLYNRLRRNKLLAQYYALETSGPM